MYRLILLARMPAFFLATAFLCRLKLPVQAVLWIVSGIQVLVLKRQREKEEDLRQRAEEGYFYMEQLIYSFRKHHKIPAALHDMTLITEGRLYRCTARAAEQLEKDVVSENLFQTAFSGIEAEYGMPLLRQLHTFLIRVEEQGGDCTTALNLLLEQLRTWKKYENAFWSRKKSIQSRLVLAIVLSCFICLAVVRMMPAGSRVTELLAYQICTGTGLFLFQLLYLLFRTVSAGDQRESRQLDMQQIEKLYLRLESSMHGPRYLRAVRRLEKEVRLYFSEWMFDMILRLQTENVQTAIAHSLDDAPEVLVRPLYRLIQQQQADPVSIQPYLNFLKELELPEVHAVMLQLYAINDMGKEEIREQIYAMLEQNQRMEEVADELKADTVLSWMGMLAALPMLVSVAVLVINLSLMLFSFLGRMHLYKG
ncbi:MAG: hypothetical protein Q4F21_01040 [Lachnospiraceae bacterium]|nr:hypothetical protein [Lachnospiraceae bacterium]